MNVPTEYAPAERASAETLRTQYSLFQSSALHRRLFNSVPVITMVLNTERQIVFANQALLDFAGAAHAEEICGLRPGELLECANAAASPAGCGTSRQCSVCGALEAILSSRLGSPASMTARITRQLGNGKAILDLELRASPLDLEGQRFTVLCALDITGRARAQALEQLVARDLMPLAGALRALARAVEGAETEEGRSAAARLILSVAEHLGAAAAGCPAPDGDTRNEA